MARRLLGAVRDLLEVEVLHPVEANSVFARIPPGKIAPLQRASFFWPWDERAGTVRWIVRLRHRADDVDRFAGDTSLGAART